MEKLSPAPWPNREADTHKGSYGTVLIVAGCRSYPGAAILAALGAARLGAGLVRLGVPSGCVAEVLPAVPFSTVVRCEETPEGALAAEAAPTLLAAAADADAVVIGPGLGTDSSTGSLVESLVRSLEPPLVIDADGLNLLLGSRLRLLSERTAPTVLTPHPGEFGRLTEASPPRGDLSRQQEATSLARTLGVVVVLKGHHTVVTDGQRVYLETGGNPGMATGGMGDVLAGAVGTVLAQGADPAEGAALAVSLHAQAGDLAADELGQAGLLPQDVAHRLGRVARDHRG